MAFIYPPARRAEVSDDYHGTIVADPYRWTEDPDDLETREFVRAQNALTVPYLASLPEVAQLRSRITELWDTPRTGSPQQRGDVVVWQHNDGLLDQPIFYVSHAGRKAEVLLDPNTMSADGAVAVTAWSLSPDGSTMAYTLSEAGSDQQIGRVLETPGGEHLSDELLELRFTGLSWWGNGFFYSRFPGLEAGTTGLFEHCSVFYHEVGTDQGDDQLIFANPDRADLLYGATVSDDDRYLVLTEVEGTSHENGLLYKPLDQGGTGFTRIVPTGRASHVFLAHHNGSFLIQTNVNAPNGKVVAIPLDDLERRVDVITERELPIEIAGAAAERIVLITLSEGAHHVELFGLDGSARGEIELPAPGTVAELNGRLSDPVVFIGFQSFLHPPSALRWEAGQTSDFASSTMATDPADFIVERMEVESTDGDRVGMFLIKHRDTPLPAPTELYGYGGFNINLTPLYSPARLAWLEAGGAVALANLRGGSEKGEEWHRQGILGNKQQVFDDFIACAGHLIDTGVTTEGGLGIRGASNGGLLTTAVMLQRPELFGAVVAQVPVTDMYRYQHFTAGRYWTVEYGDAAQDAEAFSYLSAYSPLHNVASDVDYPPLLVLTAETDDRVVPMHSHKLIAEMQHTAGGRSENPLLERVETRAGHGLGKPTSKLIDEAADVYGFMLHHLSHPGPER